MKTRLLDILCCPGCGGKLIPEPLPMSEEVVEGRLTCNRCRQVFPLIAGVPRFVPGENYADNFGLQWQLFSTTQLDSHSGTNISRDRLWQSTGWDWTRMEGKRILDVGCGAGRFAEVAAHSGAEVVILDFSIAVDAAASNLADFQNVDAVQASAMAPPFVPQSFDYIYCLGVLQHTPDPEGAFTSLLPLLKPGGGIAVDVYPRLWRNVLWSKYWLRPITKRLPDRTLLKLVRKTAPSMLRLSRSVVRTPRVGRFLRYAVPVANYDGVYELTEAQFQEWAVLDTFDMLAPAHDHPQSEQALWRWFRTAGLEDIEVFRVGHLIARGRSVSSSEEVRSHTQ